jgi:hypothetical protein
MYRSKNSIELSSKILYLNGKNMETRSEVIRQLMIVYGPRN